MKDPRFDDMRRALHSRHVSLKKQGLGNRPNRSVAVSQEEEGIFWTKGVLGWCSPFALVFILWYHVMLLMGLRSHEEHRSIMFGDL